MRLLRSALAAALVAGIVLGPGAATGVAASPTPGSYAYSEHSLCAPPADTVGPAVNTVTFGRATIDLDSGSREQTVTASVSDASGNGDPSGVDQVHIQIAGQNFYKDVALSRSSGTPAAGGWTGRFPISPAARAGTYSITSISAVDAAANQQVYDTTTSGGPNRLSQHPADDPTFTVTGTPPAPPSRTPAGRLSAFAFTPSQVDTTSASRLVHVTARFSGAAPRHVVVGFSTLKPRTVVVDLHGPLRHGSAGWAGSVRIPRWLGDQTMTAALSASWGRAFVPSSRGVSAADLTKRGFPTRLHVVSGVDSKRPDLTSLSFSPGSIDTTAGPRRVTVTAHATDVGSGVMGVEVSLGIRHGVNGIADGTYPHAADGYGYLAQNSYRVQLHKTSSGAWVGGLRIRQCVPSGRYHAVARLFDARDNTHFYPTGSLSMTGLDSTIDVTSDRGDVAFPFIWSATADETARSITLGFSEGVTNVDASTLEVYALAPRNGQFQTKDDITGINCADEAGATVDCSNPGATITSATLTVSSLEPRVRYDIFANENQVAPQLVDINGNPLNWNAVVRQVQG